MDMASNEPGTANVWETVKNKRKERSSSDSSSFGFATPVMKRPLLYNGERQHGVVKDDVTGSASDVDPDTDILTDIGLGLDSADQTALLKTVVSLLKDMRGDVKSIKSEQAGIRAHMRSISEHLDNVDEKLGMCHSAIDILDEKQRDLSNALANMGRRVEEKMGSLEDQSRRSNLVFYGLPENPWETWNQTEKIVRDFVQENLDVPDIADPNIFEIERAHRVGKRGGSGPRPVIVRFLRWKSRMKVLDEARSTLTKESPVKVGEDFSAIVRETRRKLIPRMVEARKQGKKASLRYDKLLIDGTLYTLSPSGDLKPVNELASQNQGQY